MVTTLFDAYGTLFDVYSVTAACDRVSPSLGWPLAQMWRAKQLQYTLLRSLMGQYAPFSRVTEDALVYCAASFGLELSASARADLMAAYLELSPFDDVRGGLEAVKAQGAGTAILSNGEATMLQPLVTAAELDGLVDTILTVESLQVYKPSPIVYTSAAGRLGVPQQSLVFVSSNPWDVCGAAAAGLQTVWLRRNAAEPPDELGIRPSHVIASLGELASLLAAL